MHGHASGQAPAAGAVVNPVRPPLPVALQKVSQRSRAQTQGIAVHVHEHRPGAVVAHGVAGGDKGQGLGDHLRLGAHPRQLQRQLEGRGAVDRRHRKPRPGKGGDALLERRHLGPHRGDKVGVDAVHEILALVAFEHRAVQGDGTRAVEGADDGDQGVEAGCGVSSSAAYAAGSRSSATAGRGSAGRAPGSRSGMELGHAAIILPCRGHASRPHLAILPGL